MQEPGERVILFAKENIKEDEINVFDKLFYIQKLFKAAYHQIFPLSFASLVPHEQLLCSLCCWMRTQNTIFRYMAGGEDEEEAQPDNMANVYFGSFWFTRLGIYTDISFAPERIRFYQSVQLSVKIESIFFLFFRRPLSRLPLHAQRRKSARSIYKLRVPDAQTLCGLAARWQT
jgi:hypothetical protein